MITKRNGNYVYQLIIDHNRNSIWYIFTSKIYVTFINIHSPYLSGICLIEVKYSSRTPKTWREKYLSTDAIIFIFIIIILYL